MDKLAKLRKAVLDSDKIEADQLFTFIRDGEISGDDTSIKYDAEVVIIISDWMSTPHKISRALAKWKTDYEPNATEPLRFESYVIDHGKIDIHFFMPFTANVVFDNTGTGDENEVVMAECSKPLPDLNDFAPDGRVIDDAPPTMNISYVAKNGDVFKDDALTQGGSNG